MAEGGGVGRDFDFIKSKIGIAKIIQFALSLLTLIIVAATRHWSLEGFAAASFVDFTTSFACITLLISIFIYMCKLYNLPLVSRLPWKMLEMGYGALCAVLYFISMAICGWIADNRATSLKGSFVAGAVFSAITMIIFILYTIMIFREEEIPSESNK